MSKRISIKGQGADLFFEGSAERPEGPPSDVEAPPPPTPPAGLPDSKTARQTASKTARQLARQTARQQDRKTAGKTPPPAQALIDGLNEETKHRLRSLLKREHRTHNTFRYNPQELAAVRDIVYELETRWGSKVTRNDVMRAALNWVIEDYRERQQDSFLARLFEEED